MHPLFARLKAELDDAKRECANIEEAIRMFDALGPGVAKSWARWKAVAAGIDTVYSGIERILRSMAKEIDRYVPADEHWHASLLKQMALPLEGIRGPVLSQQTYTLLNDLRAFRHLVRNLYGFSLVAERVEENFERLRQVLPAFEDDFRSFTESFGGRAS